MAKVPEGYHVVRRHIRRNPRPSTKKLSGWTIAGLIAGVWLWSQLFGFGEASSSSPHAPQTQTPSVSATAGR
ncbi:hypothetical protein ACIRU3_44630 [Streptomyces sp. NPDC101151]|uniref:hypothetical protein n=1 Tax=Streptomyces sp. NPDC101151 TaxID=3366115 RepID=UPI00382EE13D